MNLQHKIDSSLVLRRIVRDIAGSDNNLTVHVVEDSKPPTTEGESYYWTTLSGKTRVRYPNAYKWPTLYWPSTRRVEVGKLWLAELLAIVAAYEAAKTVILDSIAV